MVSWESEGALLGRDAELAALASVAERVVDGMGTARPVVHLAGEPGMGKSRLLASFAALATKRGMRVVTGRATEFEAHTPFAAVADALDEPVASAVESGEMCLDGREAELLPHLLPSLEPRPSPPRIERHRLYHAVRAVIARLAGPGGLVLAFDDVHWADQGTLEVLRYLVRRPPPAPVLLVLSFRPRQLAAGHVAALGGDAPAGTLTRLDLGPLTVPEADLLLGPAVGPARRRELYERSQGNPLYLIELAKSEDAEVDLGPFHRELAALPGAELVVLRAAAVAGEDADLALVAAVADREVTATARAIGALTARDLLRPAPDGRFHHRHPLLRHAVYAGSPPGWRMDAHRRAAGELARRGAGPVAIAEQLSRCARPGELTDVDHLAEAAALAVSIAPASAAHWLATALRVLPRTPEHFGRRVDMLTQRVSALHRAGKLPEAREAVQRALAVVTANLPEHFRLVGLAATVERLLGRYAEARALTSAALDRVPAGDGETRSVLLTELVLSNVLAGDFRAAQEFAADIGGHDLGSVVAVANLALAALAGSSGGTFTPEDLARLVEADHLVDGLTDAELGALIEIPVWLGLANLRADRLDAAARHLSRGLAVAERTGQHHVLTYLGSLRSSCHFGFGRLALAAEDAEDALDSAVLSGSDQLALMALLRLANVVAWQGNLDAAGEFLDRAERLAETVGGMFAELVRRNRAICHYLRGDLAACAAEILAATGGEVTSLLTVDPVEWLALLTEADVAQGLLDRAARWVSRAEDVSANLPPGRQRGLAVLARAWLLLPESPAGSARAALRSADLLATAGDGLGQARALRLAGRALAGTGDVDGARERWERARTAAGEAGARLLAGELDQALRRLDLGARPLSERDQVIVELVRAGLPNREIAARLHLSTRSVEAGLSRIYATLGVRGRAQLIASRHADRPDSLQRSDSGGPATEGEPEADSAGDSGASTGHGISIPATASFPIGSPSVQQ